MSKLPDHLFVATGGDLYDTRVTDWNKLPPLRAAYAVHGRDFVLGLKGMQQVKSALRAGKFAWPGGYECFFMTSDGEILSYEAVRAHLRDVLEAVRLNLRDGWRVVALGCMAEEDEPVVCADTGREIT